LDQAGRTRVRWRGREFAYFAGCDYFRLSRHPRVLAALREGLRRSGLNVAASRRTTGNHPLLERLESELAGFFGAPAAVLVSSGYAAPLAAAQGLAGRFTHALLDERAHACLADAARFLNCPVIRFAHREATDATRRLRRWGRNARPLLLTDGLFAHSGEVAPLADYLQLLPARSLLLVDDAHGAGVLGAQGRGTAEWLGVRSRRVIQTVTFSKAFGTYGGAVLGSRELMRAIQENSSLFTGNTPLPLPLAHATLAALRLLGGASGRRLRQRLWERVRRLKASLRAAGLPVPDTPTPIVSVVPRSPGDVARLRRTLLTHGVFPSHIRYPGGPAGGYFRFAISSEHTEREVSSLCDALVAFQHERGNSAPTHSSAVR
jgi:7-keto-8-aminopelargonate synthetase-like enzyme